MTKTTLLENERLDDLHRCGYMIIQNTQGFCFGIDSVLLTGFAEVKKGDKLLDLCTGNGVIPILLAAKSEAAHLSGIEIQSESVDMAKRSVEYNKLSGRVNIINGDVKEIESHIKPGSFDVVSANPPYIEAGGGIIGDYSPKAIARHELYLNLDDVIKAAAYALKFRGRFYMVHRPSRLADIFCALRKYKLEPKSMRLVQPYENKAPNLLLIEATLGGGKELKVLPALVVYDKDGNYTKECRDIYYE